MLEVLVISVLHEFLLLASDLTVAVGKNSKHYSESFFFSAHCFSTR